jgi:dUTP pyrophosphatase
MDTKIVPTGIKVAVPDGYEIQVRPRSGISYKTPLRISNSPGTIDAKYRGDVGVIITNTSVLEKNILQLEEYLIDEKGNKQGTYKIRKGDRIAQIVLQEVPKIKFNKIDNIKDIEGDRNGGFGSTGI